MTYINAEFYNSTFKGLAIPEAVFDRLSAAASETIYSVCRVKPDDTVVTQDDFKTAVCYETEILYQQGGIDAITGLSVASAAGGAESLGDYSISAGSSQNGVATINGSIPVSPMALQILKRLGLMSRWAYSGFFDPWR